MRARRGTVTGIDLGYHAVKLARVEPGDARPHLTHWGIERVDPEAGPPEEAWAEALRRLLKRLKLKSRRLGRVVTLVGGRSVHVRQVVLPALSEEDLCRALPFEARKHFPLDGIQDPCFDCQILGDAPPENGSTSSPGREALVAVAPRSERNAVLAALDRAGAEPDVVDAHPLPTVNAVLTAHPLREPEETAVIIDAGAESSMLAAVRNAGGLYVRPLDYNGTQLVDAVARSREMDRNAATLRVAELSREEAEGDEEIMAAVDGFIREVEETLRFLRVRRRDWRVSRVVLCGGGVLIPGLAEWMGARLGLETVPADPVRGLELGDHAPGDRDRVLITGSVGLAVSWVE